ncbi:AraC family transcriptional regulator [Anaeromyxobacter oryzae]|uniref:AraC family transcriptional regulator n=1 Tax=Anaeromyxobacter oryzae TaxID=2918170 RepID=A0ABM7WPQ8_9BACT|nr:AraC family transcriptional regulator [Anaeromyxobacter oryzae]BDG01445.1 AraC family transcriptional regulator [Anaeromyxobacter oryzae]
MSADPLANVLGSVRLTGSVFFRLECAPPWVAEAPPSRAIAGRVMPGVDHVIEFHAITRGRCLAGIVGETRCVVEAGDVICFPHGDAHVLSSAQGLRATPDLSPYTRPQDAPLPFCVKLGTGPVETELVCGFFGCDARPFNPLLEALPRVLRASDRDGRRSGWLSRFLEVAEAESRSPGPGGAGMLSRLSELMFVELVRRHVETLPPDRTGWLAGLCDPHVGRALAVLHASPGDPWTLERLARAAGLARSSLAERFAALIGDPPMQYLTRWRMQVAAGQLDTTHDGVAAIAARVGYASEAAFSRAFKKSVGMPPAAWRRRRAAGHG